MNISAVITNYNTWPLTVQCVRELDRWSGNVVSEILIVDDASDKAEPSDLPIKVRLLRNESNLGYARSVNVGFSAVETDIVILLDSDAYPLMDLTAKTLYEFVSNPHLGALGFHLVDEIGQGTGSSSPDPSCAELLLGQRFSELYGRYVKKRNTKLINLHSCALAVRREAFESVGGFDINFDFLDADIDFSMRLRQKGWELRKESSLMVFHKGGGSPQKTSARVVRHHINRWRLLSKHRKIRWPLLLKLGLALRHSTELLLLWLARYLTNYSDDILRDKLEGRRFLFKTVWSGYGNEL
jgi:GT2 family glycosyltransferase